MRAGLKEVAGKLASERIRWKLQRNGLRRSCMKKLVVISSLMLGVFCNGQDRSQERAGRQQKIDVQSYLIDAQVDPRAQDSERHRAGALHSARRYVVRYV